ncbi:hypothetical protein [Pedobacter psychrodurus]|uniref:hypothetical protein n=1 Tax=Pedobacter psychrodurus TaxID=2530456 RepID=UPI002930C0FA|nr:hypothetical protein [Pedobacter psychrodurus]
MPIIRISDQKKKTLEEFYQELTNEKATITEKLIGKTMLSFLSMVNTTFFDTTIYGCTSHYSLCIQAEDHWESGWDIVIQTYGDQKFQFEYKMPEAISPWRYATVKGQANTIEEARNFLIIAMTESGGWADNKELRNLYHKLKGIKTENHKFKLWLEFEEVAPEDWNIDDEGCNIHVDMEDGRHYGLNIWTYKFLEKVVHQDSATGQNLGGSYQIPPDLLVKELTRACIEKTIEDLLRIGDLEKVLNRSIL